MKADIVLSSEAVFTGLEDKPRPLAVAILENRIISVAPIEEMNTLIGEHTIIQHFGNQLIMPGFHDSHVHAMMGSLSLESVNLFSARSELEAVKIVKEFSKSIPENDWIIGFMWDSSYWENKKFPTRFSLDEVFPNRPVVLFHAEGHYTWVNSKALNIANINKQTKNPPNGIIERSSNGEPTGILIEEASSLITKYAYDFTKDKKRELFRGFLKEASRNGVTSVNNLYGTETLSLLDDFEIFKEFELKDELPVRMHLYPVLNGDIKEALHLRERYQSDKLRVSGLKQFIDGVVTSRTAFMLEPYSDSPETFGLPAHSIEDLKNWVVDADYHGFNIRFHAIGDAAIRLALDSYENAQNINGKRDSRHSIEHIEVIHPDDISRFATLGVIASMQPDHFALSERETYTERIGPKREKYVFAINSIKKTGAQLSFGTDFPIDSFNPLLQIYRAITRIDSSGKAVWIPEECITLSDALKAYTYGSAFGTSREQELGTILEGKLADIVVLDRNLFQMQKEEILEASVQMTISDGKIVYLKDKTLSTIK
ncbi:amidohydrolase [Bacillus sp. AFS077874]|uniref:amidohydrolase n=1 Tax=unclassified Bacillus (in: firmicutes) TaxID=185979 RepID=UPI000BEDDF93|nr:MULTISPECIES: amidohydrolase [unclassified Bacillus (in: firmicutes)]PEC50900.1 amidohydrolase [Bacillus sp. AFS096315]PFM83212.1 amidohydrolase [Bacillus sp. AFS077874]